MADFQALNSLQNCSVAGTRTSLHFTAAAKIYLVNEGHVDTLVNAHTSLAQYYKGTWLSRKDKATENSPDTVPFCLESESDLVHHGGKVKTLKQVLEDQRQEDPTKVKVAYHTLEDAPTVDSPGGFKLTRKYMHHWKFENCPMKAETTTVSQGHAAGLVVPEQWKDFNVTCIIWVMRWTAKGLTPVRPFIITTKDIEIKSHTAVELK